MNVFLFILIIVALLAKAHLSHAISEKADRIEDDGAKFTFLTLALLFIIAGSFLEGYLMQVVVKYLFNEIIGYWTAYALCWAIGAFTYHVHDKKAVSK